MIALSAGRRERTSDGVSASNYSVKVASGIAATADLLPVRVFREADNANVLPLYAMRRQDGGLWKNRKASNIIKIIMSPIIYIM